MENQPTTLLEFLKNRYSLAKENGSNFRDMVKKNVEDYKCEKDKGIQKDETVYNKHLALKRYEFPMPYIYSTHESIMSSLFEKPFELVWTGKGQNDEEKANKIKSIYKYLYDKLDLDHYLNESAWWFVLCGFVSSYQTYEIVISGYENVLDSQGEPMFDEMGKPVTTPKYSWHDPKVFVDDPYKTHFAPDSKFSYDASQSPYLVREELVDKALVEKVYGVKDVPASEFIQVGDIDKKSDTQKSDLKRTKLMYYCGNIPEEYKKEVKEWDYDKVYHCIFIDNKVLHTEEKDKNTTLARWFYVPNEFYGFGIGKTLSSSQREISMRRGQMIKYADEYAYPWLALPSDTTIDQNALLDVTKRTPLVFNGNPPQYIIPPTMPDSILKADEYARSDAQFISGTLDISKGAQETNTVKTATGQQLFAQSQEKRIVKAKKTLLKYFKATMINLLELARDNWEEEKVISITDDEGEEIQVSVSPADLQDINFDTDIDIQFETATVNKETLAQRAIDLYDKVKDDQLIDRKKIFMKMLKDGFNVKNPEFYIREDVEQEQLGADGQPLPTESGVPGEMPESEQPQPEPSPEAPATDAPDLLGNQMAPQPV